MEVVCDESALNAEVRRSGEEAEQDEDEKKEGDLLGETIDEDEG